MVRYFNLSRLYTHCSNYEMCELLSDVQNEKYNFLLEYIDFKTYTC